MKVLFACAEALPYWKTGGLADVARGLPDALARSGHDVRILLPEYARVRRRCHEQGWPLHHEAAVSVPWPGGPRAVEIVRHQPEAGAPALFVRAQGFFDTERPYEPFPADPLSLGRRFAFFSRSVVAYARHWGADVVHLNDWQTGLVPVYDALDGMDAATVFTIHNLGYQGNFPPQLLAEVGVPANFMRTEAGLEFYGQASLIKGGLTLADRLVTVSPTYAREIRTPEYGAGLHGLLEHRRGDLHGILNGIDTEAWDPATDRLIPEQYSSLAMQGKQSCRRVLCDRAGVSGAGPVLGIVSRLAYQKGIEIILGAIPELVRQGCSLVVLGSGDPPLEHALAGVTRHFPDNVAVSFSFDEPLAHLIYAGADFFLMPSIYEPCGLGQMIAQRYGTLPIARRTGGLADTIDDGLTGFLFHEPSPAALTDAVARAAAARSSPDWPALQQRCMRRDHSWGRAAAEYDSVYRLAVGAGLTHAV